MTTPDANRVLIDPLFPSRGEPCWMKRRELRLRVCPLRVRGTFNQWCVPGATPGRTSGCLPVLQRRSSRPVPGHKVPHGGSSQLRSGRGGAPEGIRRRENGADGPQKALKRACAGFLLRIAPRGGILGLQRASAGRSSRILASGAAG